MYTRNRGDHAIFWQGPTIGFDVGGDGSKVMMLVYNLNSVEEIFGRYPGVDGSAYVVAGLGMTALKYRDVVIVPIRSGVGLRAGINVGYLKFTQAADLEPVLIEHSARGDTATATLAPATRPARGAKLPPIPVKVTAGKDGRPRRSLPSCRFAGGGPEAGRLRSACDDRREHHVFRAGLPGREPSSR